MWAGLAGPLYGEGEHTGERAEPGLFGDVVLARKDAPTRYDLAVAGDDAAQDVSDVVRGRDLFAATDVHRLLQALLGLPVPHYHHHPLLTDAEGRRLAKRNGATTLAVLCAGRTEPEKLVAAPRVGACTTGDSCGGGARWTLPTTP